MNLDKNYFNNLTLNYINNKYYNADDVDNALVEIRKNALEMCAEIESLSSQLEHAHKENAEMKELLEQIQSRRDETTKKAVDEITELLSQVEEKKKEIQQIQTEKEDRMVAMIADVFARMKDEHRENVVEINAQWQSFLTKLAEDDTPKDLSEKVKKIALEMQEISNSIPTYPGNGNNKGY